MKRSVVFFIFFLFILYGYAQKIQTIVPSQVVVGNAFQIQFIINDPAAFVEINAPQFDNLQLISGPNYYKGKSLVNGKTQSIENITYTVVPVKTGTIKINPVTARFKNNEEERSDEITINVSAQPKASFNALSTYTDINLYAPSSKTDLDKLIKTNLFVKTEVDKKHCFLGQAITATFKLYSRLQSTSEVINAPSLYGFSVMDMLNINEAHQAVETINGKIFNTSILRKLQLYPAQSGKLIIDEMQLQNSIEFNDSISTKKIRVEKLLASDAVDIMVKPLPSKQPADYTGAVGQFTMSADLPTPIIVANAPAKLLVTIKGEGNFIQFGPPVINFPKEFDVFDPVVSDELNRGSVPTEGRRNYIFTFTTDRTGCYSVSPVSFSFFDVQSCQYKKVTTDSLKFEVTAATGKGKHDNETVDLESTKKSWKFFVVIAVLFAVIVGIFRTRKNQKSVPVALSEKTNYILALNSLLAGQLTDKQFCSEIQKLLAGIERDYKLLAEQKLELEAIKIDCQLIAYSEISTEGKREELRQRTGNLIKQLSSNHSAYL